MRKRIVNLSLLFFMIVMVVLSIWGPELFSRYNDRFLMGKVHEEEVALSGEGYRYQLSSSQRLYILSRALDSQILPGIDQSSAGMGDSYQELTGSYAFVQNYRDYSKEETDQDIYGVCNRELRALKDMGILPEEVLDVEEEHYDAVLYSAIDVREPRNYVTVWRISLSNIQKNANKSNRLIDAYIDADQGTIYEFYVRSERLWEEMDPDNVIETWSSYVGLPEPEPYTDENPLAEATPYFKKYMFAQEEQGGVVVTTGFYQGINEFFIKIAR